MWLCVIDCTFFSIQQLENCKWQVWGRKEETRDFSPAANAKTRQLRAMERVAWWMGASVWRGGFGLFALKMFHILQRFHCLDWKLLSIHLPTAQKNNNRLLNTNMPLRVISFYCSLLVNLHILCCSRGSYFLFSVCFAIFFTFCLWESVTCESSLNACM